MHHSVTDHATTSTNFRTYLQNINIPELENEKADFIKGNSIRDALIAHIRKLTAENEAFHFVGSVEKIGSSWDGSKLHQIDEVDLLFVLNGSEIQVRNTGETFSVLLSGKLFEPRELVEQFADSLDDVLAINPPDNLYHGGYASPEYSGVRLCGPAVTVLYQTREKSCISLDITMCVPLSNIHMFQTPLDDWVKIKLSCLNEPCSWPGLHAVPNVTHNRWQLSSALFEAELLNRLESNSTVRKAYLRLKALLDWVDKHAVQTNMFGISGLQMDDKSMKLGAKLVAFIKSNKVCKGNLKRCMRYGHMLLSMQEAFEYSEVGKEDITINKAAAKHFLLTEAQPRDFQDNHQNAERIVQLMKRFIERIGSPDPCVEHALKDHLPEHHLHSPDICIFAFRKSMVGKYEELATKLQRCYKMVLENAFFYVSIARAYLKFL